MTNSAVIEAYIDCVIEALRDYAKNPDERECHVVKWALEDFRHAVNKSHRLDCGKGECK